MKIRIAIVAAFLCLTGSGCQGIIDRTGAQVDYSGSVEDHEQRGMNQIDTERSAHEEYTGSNPDK